MELRCLLGSRRRLAGDVRGRCLSHRRASILDAATGARSFGKTTDDLHAWRSAGYGRRELGR
jgi:hypothetical protein